jgi:PTS system D-glucosamine-specific IIC component
MFKQIFAVLHRVGKALMLPVAFLPAAGILLGFGNAMQNPNLTSKLAFLKNDAIIKIAKLIEAAGDIIFGNLALLFAVGVAIGLAGDGAAGLAAIVGFKIMNNTMSVWLGVTPEVVANGQGYANVLGLPTLQTGVFGGIIIGLIAAWAYGKYHNLELPQFLGFFAGKPFVPIVTALVSLVAGLELVFVWPFAQDGLNTFSHFMMEQNPTLAAFVFGLIERSLIPFGLQHIFYAPFWFEFGSYKNAAGTVVHGDQAIFFAQMKDNAKLSAGTFMTGKFPFMMFGLPAAALAMYHEARPERRAVVGGLLGSAALTAFLTGITEPI